MVTMRSSAATISRSLRPSSVFPVEVPPETMTLSRSETRRPRKASTSASSDPARISATMARRSSSSDFSCPRRKLKDRGARFVSPSRDRNTRMPMTVPPETAGAPTT
jgi:hypothetical protein